ncbi:MAG: LD-carboxypeptidase [Chitinophagaceae bacterium]|nr:MAG: LD-carboxypeptidase [Chitinophagaceae bacterium]
MIKTPAYLEPGDTIGIVCPAGYMAYDRVAECIRVLTEEWGFKVKVGKTVGGEPVNYFSGTDKERLDDVQSMIDDDEVKAILFARGGYGMGRIIDDIDFTRFRKHPKWMIGYSDITVLHTHLYTNYYISSMHAPMAGAFNNAGYINRFVQSLKSALAGDFAKYHCEPHEFNTPGEGIGELVGGNLALLVNVIGTDSDFKTRGRILFIEDVGEYIYNADRMFSQLKRAGKLKKLAGLVIGGFTDMKDTERPFGQTIYEAIRDHVKEYDYPVCFGFPVSHTDENYALKIGVGYKLKVSKHKVTLEE